MFNTIAGDIVRMLHLKIGSFETVYAKFSAWATTWYGSIGNIHLGNAADSKSLQFASTQYSLRCGGSISSRC